MSLKPCRECGEQISSHARNCPKCGIKKLINKKTLWLPLGLGLFTIPIAYTFAPPVTVLRVKAELGFAEAQYRFSRIYHNGDGVPQNSEESFKWLQKAGEGGNAEAQKSLGFIYRTGEEIPNGKEVVRDDVKAKEWYKKAAALGDTEAQFILGTVYHESQNLPTREGSCAWTVITEIGHRLQDGANGFGIPGSGSSVQYSNGGFQVSYDEVDAVTHSRTGDKVIICLIEAPRNCPAGDIRGYAYITTNLRIMESWIMGDSSHSCGGA